MQISSVQNSFAGRMIVKYNAIGDYSDNRPTWQNIAGPACKVISHDKLLAGINTDCVSMVSADKIVVKDSPYGRDTYFLDVDYKDPVSLNTLISAYNAANQKEDLIIDTTI